MVSYMTCTTCKGVVLVNNTGICLRCQGGFTQTPQGDELGYESDYESDSENTVTLPQPCTLKKKTKGPPPKKAKK